MRWIFITLLMCNGIFFLWQNYLVEDAVVAANAATVKYGNTVDDGFELILLSESGLVPTDEMTTDKAEGLLKNEVLPLVAEPVPVLAPRKDEPVESRVCWQIGPFNEEVSARQVVGRLAEVGIVLRLQAIDLAAGSDYWVYLPPEGSRNTAIKLLRELQAKKIDSFLITKGDLVNGISLGLFSQKARADAVFSKRIDQGYSPEIKEIVRINQEFWLILDERESGKLTDDLWQKIIQGNEMLERRKNYCDKIASAVYFD